MGAFLVSCNQNIQENDLNGSWSIQYILKDSVNVRDYYNYCAATTFTNPLSRKMVKLPCISEYINKSQWKLKNDTIEFYNSEYGDLEGKYKVEFDDETWKAGHHWLILYGDSVDLYFIKNTFSNGGYYDVNYYPKKLE